MAGHPLRPAIRRRLGGPLPRQLADGTQPHPQTIKSLLHPHEDAAHHVLACLSARYPRLGGRSVTRYSPVRHCLTEIRPFDLHVLSTPPAFTLSQNQTLHKMVCHNPEGSMSVSFDPSLRLAVKSSGLHSCVEPRRVPSPDLEPLSGREKPPGSSCRTILLSHLLHLSCIPPPWRLRNNTREVVTCQPLHHHIRSMLRKSVEFTQTLVTRLLIVISPRRRSSAIRAGSRSILRTCSVSMLLN